MQHDTVKGIFFTVVGGLLLLACLVTAIGIQRFRGEASRAPGVVERLNAGGSHPEIAFVTARGEHVSYPQGGLIFGYRPGDRVEVLYRVERPTSSATIASFGALWAMPLLLGFLGAGFALGGILTWLAERGA